VTNFDDFDTEAQVEETTDCANAEAQEDEEFPEGVECPNEDCGAANRKGYVNIRQFGPGDFECRCCGIVFSA